MKRLACLIIATLMLVSCGSDDSPYEPGEKVLDKRSSIGYVVDVPLRGWTNFAIVCHKGIAFVVDSGVTAAPIDISERLCDAS